MIPQFPTSTKHEKPDGIKASPIEVEPQNLLPIPAAQLEQARQNDIPKPINGNIRSNPISSGNKVTKKSKRKLKAIPRTKVKPKSYSYFTMFKLIHSCEWIILVIGGIAALLSGACIPIINHKFGNLTNEMVFIDIIVSPEFKEQFEQKQRTPFCSHLFEQELRKVRNENETKREVIKEVIQEKIDRFSMEHAMVAGTMAILYSIYFLCFYVLGERMINRLSVMYFEALLRKDMRWLDLQSERDFSNILIQNIQQIRAGVRDVLGTVIGYTSVFILCVLLAFLISWKVAILSCISIPLLGVVSIITASFEAKQLIEEQISYSHVGSLAEEVLINIRTVFVYLGQLKEFNEFSQRIDTNKKVLFKRSLILSITYGMVWLIEYGNNALTFWYGTLLVLEDRRNCTLHANFNTPLYPGDLVTIGDCMIFGAVHFGLLLPLLESMFVAHQCCKKVFPVIDTHTEIDSMAKDGIRPASPVEGNIEFNNVWFSYPARDHLAVLKGVSFTVTSGMTVALVGKSGSGKSSVLKLISREYKQTQGTIKIDGYDIGELNISWLRSQISVVTQDSGLFDLTVRENVGLGRNNPTLEEIKEACDQADATEFIKEFENGLNEEVGFQGHKLSGGQKQRLAIARALIKRPRILLLDEPTSALDNQSEAIVQRTLHEAAKERTTFVVAHRLNTVTQADLILVFDDGEIVESGTHNFLMKLKGEYYDLVTGEIETHRMLNVHAKPSRKFNEIPFASTFALSKLIPNKNSTVTFTMKTSRNSLANLKDNKDAKSMCDTISCLSRQRSLASLLSQENSIVEREQKVWDEFLKFEDKIKSRYKSEKPGETDTKSMRFVTVLKLVSSYRCLICLGIFGSIIIGAILPVYGVLFGEIIGELSNLNDEDALANCRFFCLMFAITGCVAGFAVFLQNFSLGAAANQAVDLVRRRLFFCFLRQDQNWHDDPANEVSILTTRLNTDAGSLQSVVVTSYGVLIQCTTSIIAGLLIPFLINPRFTSICMLLVPLVISASFIEGWLAKMQERKGSETLDEISKLVLEVFQNKHVVTTCQLENYFINKFKITLKACKSSTPYIIVARSLAFGIAQSASFLTYSVCMYLAGKEIEHIEDRNKTNFKDVLTIGDTLIFGLLLIGSSLTVLPAYITSIDSGKRLISLLRQKPVMNDKDGIELKHSNGILEFKDVHFHYPSRKEVDVIRGISFHAKPGEMIALVGASGSGKSTCIDLILRFHDISSGSLTLDGKELCTINCNSIRSQIALVEQESRLFDRTIAENISYGDNSRVVLFQEILTAAIEADIHTFITSLPEGYNTKIGSAGSLLSGGQAQRIAIARALLKRSRKLLILDEATSALDQESEQLIMDSIEQIRKERTCIAVAHRLVSIKNANMIIVMEQGKIVECGNHTQLIGLKGYYFNLWNSQNSSIPVLPTTK